LLDAKRMQRLAVISRQDSQAPSPQSVVSALLAAAFSASSRTPAEQDLAGVVESEVVERLMILAANSEATAEVRAVALAGVHEAQNTIKGRSAGNPVMQQLDHEIVLFLQNPAQNTPKLKLSGAPAGPPV
jgi:hypothetical protein